MQNEIERLNAVSRFTKLDDNITKDLNELVALAAQICNTPFALTTLLDKNVQFFTSSKGVEIDCTSRELAFCNYTIAQDELLMITDMANDERFVNHPFVTGEPNIRFYAGFPLKTSDGFSVGSLCVLDLQPRELTAHQQYSLKVLAKQVINLLELSRSLETLAVRHEETRQQKIIIEQSEIKLNAMFNSSKDIHLLLGRDMDVLAFNKAAADHVRLVSNRKLKYKDNLVDFLDPAIAKPLRKYFEIALLGKTIKKEWMMWPGTKHACWKETTMIAIRNNLDEVIGVALNSTDVTERKMQDRMIKIQNEALTRIAIIQSHELRRPVASLLGLVDLIKLDQGEGVSVDYLEMLEQTVQELDEKIRGIVKHSEETISVGRLKIVA